MSEDQTDDQADDEKAAGADSPAPTTMTDVDKSTAATVESPVDIF